jgi:uncharacterized protein (DUF2132 family)
MNEETKKRSKDPLEGVTLEMLLTELVENVGWQKLGKQISINCFNSDPSISSSLKFLRRTPWARTKVEKFYLDYLKSKK